jgi:integrase
MSWCVGWPSTAVRWHGAHDLRHTYATWLEDAGIPDRVIDSSTS